MAQVLLNHHASPSFSVHSRVAIARHQHSQAETGFHKSSHCMYDSTRVCHKTNLVRLGGWKWDRNHYLLKFIAEHQWSPQFLCLAAYLPTFPGDITANQVCSSWQFSILSVSCVLSKHLFNISPPIMYIPDIPEWFLCKKIYILLQLTKDLLRIHKQAPSLPMTRSETNPLYSHSPFYNG